MAQRFEDTIRDYLVEDISLLGQDLTVMEKEKYVPHHLGTRGFIDILAKDGRGNFVIIELKRSGASSREAIHEVFKYVEGIKQQQLANDGEIRV
ncbi:MAG: endonuclease NucS domain-containing protein, partial [Longimicrobiaceae bacterium]